MRTMLAAVAMAAVAVPSAAWACDGAHMASAPKPEVKQVNVQQVVELQKKLAVYVYDANSEKTRANQGVIPGASLLTSATTYDVQKELTPVKDAPIVFYCANEKCRSSVVAAERAARSGYTNVSVLPVGITGWKAAGQRVVRPTS